MYLYMHDLNKNLIPVFSGDIVEYGFRHDVNKYEIEKIYTYYGNPGCYHDRVKLRNITTGKTKDTSMIMFCNTSMRLLKDNKWLDAIVVKRDYSEI